MTVSHNELLSYRKDSQRSLKESKARRLARATREYESRHNLPVKAISLLAATSLTVLQAASIA